MIFFIAAMIILMMVIFEENTHDRVKIDKVLSNKTFQSNCYINLDNPSGLTNHLIIINNGLKLANYTNKTMLYRGFLNADCQGPWINCNSLIYIPFNSVFEHPIVDVGFGDFKNIEPTKYGMFNRYNIPVGFKSECNYTIRMYFLTMDPNYEKTWKQFVGELILNKRITNECDNIMNQGVTVCVQHRIDSDLHHGVELSKMIEYSMDTWPNESIYIAEREKTNLYPNILRKNFKTLKINMVESLLIDYCVCSRTTFFLGLLASTYSMLIANKRSGDSFLFQNGVGHHHHFMENFFKDVNYSVIH